MPVLFSYNLISQVPFQASIILYETSRSSVFQKRWQIMIGQVNNLTRHLDQGVKRGCFPGQQYCGMLYKTVHSTLITINRNKVCNQVYPVGVMYRAIKTSDQSDWEFFYFYFLFALYKTLENLFTVLTVQFIQAFVKRVNEVLMPVEKCFFFIIIWCINYFWLNLLTFFFYKSNQSSLYTLTT